MFKLYVGNFDVNRSFHIILLDKNFQKINDKSTEESNYNSYLYCGNDTSIIVNKIFIDYFRAPIELLLTQDDIYEIVDNPEVVRRLKEKGYDGAIIDEPNFYESSLFVVEPNQIKSVHNKGTFDESNPNILMSKSEQREQGKAELKEKIKKVETGKFGEHMEVELLNDGPVTIMLEK